MLDPARSQYPGAGEYNVSAETVDDLQQLTLDQIAASVGGPTHRGQGMRLADPEVRLTKSSYAVLISDLAALLDKFNITEPARGEMMAVIATLAPPIVDE
jgi:hypothetical protein